jgi:hypothetical protein
MALNHYRFYQKKIGCRTKKVYVSGPLTNGLTCSAAEIHYNIMLARDLTMELWKLGFGVYCPHMNTSFFSYEIEGKFLEFDCDILEGCDFVLVTNKNLYLASPGTILEIALARQCDIPVYFSMEEVRRNEC